MASTTAPGDLLEPAATNSDEHALSAGTAVEAGRDLEATAAEHSAAPDGFEALTDELAVPEAQPQTKLSGHAADDEQTPAGTAAAANDTPANETAADLVAAIDPSSLQPIHAAADAAQAGTGAGQLPGIRGLGEESAQPVQSNATTDPAQQSSLGVEAFKVAVPGLGPDDESAPGTDSAGNQPLLSGVDAVHVPATANGIQTIQVGTLVVLCMWISPSASHLCCKLSQAACL